MSKSNAKKKLEHKLRNSQKLDPREKRGSWGDIKPIQRVLPNKKKDYFNKKGW